jgi:tRNA modification GTPase
MQVSDASGTSSVRHAEPLAIRVALLTPPGRGALAVVGIAGQGAASLVDASFYARGGASVAARRDAAVCFGRWGGDGDASGEDVVVVRHSAERVEVHGHGGHAAAEAVITRLEAGGATRQTWPNWLQDNGMPLLDLEAREALCHGAGSRAARILVRQAAGLLDNELVRLASLSLADRTAGVARLLAASRVGLRLADPWSVVLVGAVNAGKSSLANALAGHARSIVSPEPGTTRDLVTTRLVLDGFDVELVDTAGLRESDAETSATERAGIERAETAAAAADLVLRIVPASDALQTSPPTAPNELIVVTKADLATGSWNVVDGRIVTSIVDGRGIAELAAAIMGKLVPELAGDPTLLDGPVPFTERQVMMIRDLAR